MRSFTALVEALEARPDDADRVAALARHLRAVGRDAGAVAGRWLVVGARPRRPTRLAPPALAAAAARLAENAGTAPWLFEAGVAASTETAEAIALLLPWPDAAQAGSTCPSLVDWLAAWCAAAAAPANDRAVAMAAAIAALDDAVARRWAVRAACGLVRPIVEPWQWQRAWAQAFGEDAHALAWAWHHDASPDPAFALHPRAFAPLADADDAAHADLLAAWRADALWAEPRWRGERVQLVRRGAALALWHADGRLASAALREPWLVAADWPDPCVVDAVLVARGAARHLVLVDWQRWADDEADVTPPAERRATLLARWPTIEIAVDAGECDGDGDGADTSPCIDRAGDWPPIFATPLVDATAALHADEASLATIATTAARARRRWWSGLVLRSRAPGPMPAQSVRATAQRVRAVLQYVPTEAFAAPAALAFGACGFALWSRTPLGEREQHDAMAAALDGEFLPPPSATDLPSLRLLPLARAPLELPDDALAAIHAWLRAHAGRRFGGVHAVLPALVFELGFARARPSTRHRLGWALERPRVLRWLADAPAGVADRVEDLAALVDGEDDATAAG